MSGRDRILSDATTLELQGAKNLSDSAGDPVGVLPFAVCVVDEAGERVDATSFHRLVRGEKKVTK